jgi:hypothetical protein
MALLSDYYAPRIRVPQMFQRGKTQTSELAIYRNGGIVTPTSPNECNISIVERGWD